MARLGGGAPEQEPGQKIRQDSCKDDPRAGHVLVRGKVGQDPERTLAEENHRDGAGSEGRKK